MTKIIAVAVGGSIGATARYLVSLFFINHTHLKFPYATFIVNMAGCFLIGLLYSLFSGKIVSIELRLFLITGFLGALTTFSTYNFESVMLIKERLFVMAVFYFVLSNFAGIAFLYAGMKSGDFLK